MELLVNKPHLPLLSRISGEIIGICAIWSFEQVLHTDFLLKLVIAAWFKTDFCFDFK